MINKTLKRVFGMVAVLVMTVIMIRMFAQVRKNPSARDEEEEEEEEAIKSPSRVSVQNGQTVITLDPESQSNIGITVASLKAITAREQVTAPAVILSAQELVNARNSYVAALARLEKARADVEVAQQESERLKALYQDNQNGSQKALQLAQGTLRSNQADALAARQDLALQAAALRQSWGGVIAKWMVDDPPPLDRVFNQHDFLVQVTVAAGIASAAPETIRLELPGSGHTQAELISPFPRVDPRIQGTGFLYIAQNHLGLAPGLNLAARLPVGRLMRGVLVPQQAVVWWQGNAWVYQQTIPDRFVRRRVPDEMPLANGGFISEGFSPGDRIVTAGAQALLSEESRSLNRPQE
jgi:hypothetical protein